METLFQSFQMRAQAVSAEVHRFARRAEALDFIAGHLGPSAVWAAGQPLAETERERLLAAAPGLTFEVTREAAARASAGVIEVEWAIADTGTLAGDFTAVERRLASTLPPLHIALVPTAAIQPNLPALFARLDPRRSPYLSLITGPSRTADIERVLTIGVHGPKRLVIVFVDESPRNA